MASKYPISVDEEPTNNHSDHRRTARPATLAKYDGGIASPEVREVYIPDTPSQITETAGEKTDDGKPDCADVTEYGGGDSDE